VHNCILDHVGNVLRHGLPDAPRKWSLDRRERKSKSAPSDAVPLRACPECSQPYERVLPACPWCGHEPLPTVRSSPEAVEGDLHQLSPEVLARMRGEVLALESGPRFPLGATMEVVGAIKKRWMQATEARGSLAEAMALWGGKWHEAGDTDRMIQRRFYLAFGVDVLSAQALNRADAEELEAKVRGTL
jgi:DNA repair protein RadD